MPPSADPSTTWNRGDQILLRYRRLGPVSVAIPATVVHDEPGGTTLYLRPGTPITHRVMPDGSPIPRDLPYTERSRLPHQVGHGMWSTHHVLIDIGPGNAFDIRHFWSEDWAFRGWYVNLQDPVRRVRTGFDTADHILDLQVSPDGAWRWKDEHEMAEAVQIGRFSPDDATAIRHAGESVIPMIESRQPPFDGAFIGWRPDPAWPLPTLPDDWNAD